MSEKSAIVILGENGVWGSVRISASIGPQLGSWLQLRGAAVAITWQEKLRACSCWCFRL